MEMQGCPNGREVFLLVSEIARTLRCCQQDQVFCENVTFSQFLILDLVGQKGRLRLSDLHSALSVEKSTTTRLVSPLVSQGLVLREKSEHDSRALDLRLTGKGESVRKKVWFCLSEFVERLEAKIPEKDRAGVYQAVKVFLGAMREASSAPQCCVQTS